MIPCRYCAIPIDPATLDLLCRDCAAMKATWERLIQEGAAILDPPDFWDELALHVRHERALNTMKETHE